MNNIITFHSLAPIWPELFMSVAGLLLLVVGVLKKENSTRFISWSTIWVLVVGLFIMVA